MFRENSSHQRVGVIRHPDGSINFNAYRAAARSAREAAIVSSIEGAVHTALAMLSSVGAALAGKSASHPPHHAK
jgi:hypothetical protein